MTPVTDKPRLINRAADCNIRKFMACLFDNDYSALMLQGDPGPTKEELQAAFTNIYIEYSDLSGGTAENPELDLMKDIQKHSMRLNIIDALLYVQHTSLPHFHQPHEGGLQEFKKYGHRLKWTGNIEEFTAQLKKVENSEAKTREHLRVALDGLEELRKKQQEKDSGNVQNARKEFINIIIALQREKYVIDYDKTSVEELAIMVDSFNKLNQQTAYN